MTTQHEERDDRALVAAIIRIGETLGLNLVAEGIETQAELTALRRLGVGYGQGYLLARPGALPLAGAADRLTI